MARPSFKPIGAIAITVLARVAAKKAIKEQLRADGVRVMLVPACEIEQRARAYLDANPRLYEEALERAKQMGMIAERNS
jgi:hypothetical protein